METSKKDYGAHPVQITKWKKSAPKALPGHLSRRKEASERLIAEEERRHQSLGEKTPEMKPSMFIHPVYLK